MCELGAGAGAVGGGWGGGEVGKKGPIAGVRW